MALTPNLIPSQITTFPCPYDATLAFCNAQNLAAAASGYNLNNVNATLDLGGSTPVSAAGRTDFIWTTDITVMDFTTTDETYKIYLVASNNVAFTAGDVELLAVLDFGLAANRILATILGDEYGCSAGRPRRHHHAGAVHQPEAAHLLPLSAALYDAGRYVADPHLHFLDQPRRGQILTEGSAMSLKIDANQSATAFHIDEGAVYFPYAVDATQAVSAHPGEWSMTPWSREDADAARKQRDERYQADVADAKARGLPEPAPPPPPPPPLTPEDQAALDEHNKAVAEAAERLAAYHERKRKEEEEAGQVAADELLVSSPPPAPQPTPTVRPGNLPPAQMKKRAAIQEATDKEAAAKDKKVGQKGGR